MNDVNFDNQSISIGDAVAKLASVARHTALIRDRAELEANVMQTAFYFQFQIRVAFDSVLPLTRDEYMKKLQRSFDLAGYEQLAVKLRNATVLIASNVETGAIDAHARVQLNCVDSLESWAVALQTVDLTRIADMHLFRAHIDDLETELAQKLGLFVCFLKFCFYF